MGAIPQTYEDPTDLELYIDNYPGTETLDVCVLGDFSDLIKPEAKEPESFYVIRLNREIDRVKI